MYYILLSCSTIRKLEDEIRHLEHVNNRLHSQSTHYETRLVHCNSSLPCFMYCDIYIYICCDVYSWQAADSTSSHPVKHSPKQQQRSTHRSPVQLSQQPHINTTTQSSGTPNRPLTRKKWLESSIPGLMFGGEHEKDELLPPSTCRQFTELYTIIPLTLITARMPSRMSPGANNERPLKQVPGRADNKERAPTRYDPNEMSVDAALKAMKDGSLVTSSDGKHKTKKNKEQVRLLPDSLINTTCI